MAKVKIAISCLLLAFLAFVLLVFISFILSHIHFLNGFANGTMFLIEKSFSMVAIFAFCMVVANFIKDRDFYFSSYKLFSALIIGFLGFLVIAIIVSIWEKLTQDSSSIALIRQMGIGKNFFNDLWLIFAITLFAPIVEELAFRWLIYSLVKKAFCTFMPLKISILIAIGISSWAFMEIHGAKEQASQFLILFAIGIVLALIYEATSSIFAPIFAHCLNNSLALYQNISGAKISLFSVWHIVFLLLLPFFSIAIVFIMKKIFDFANLKSI